MTEEREWMKRIQDENAHLKNQIRLLRENYELRAMLGQQCDNSSQVQFLTSPISPVYTDAGLLSTTNTQTAFLAVVNKTVCVVVVVAPYFGREDFGYCSHVISKESTVLPNPSAQSPLKQLQNEPPPFQPRSGEKKPGHLSSMSCSTIGGKQLEEPTELMGLKKAWLMDGPFPGGDKAQTPLINQNSKRNGRIVGEIAFQLDRRILAHVFPGITRLYGFTVSNIPEKIKQVSMKSLDGSVDEKKYRAMTQRYLDLTARLEKMGYHVDVHPVFSEFLINTYGILKQRPDLSSNPLHNSPADLRKMVIDIVPSKFLGDTLLLLNCLCELSKEDNKALFAW
uniref:Spermatosis and centriole associated 1 like n=1 Tax=Podarcis muralis TaxID=64176 RepID=A0A670HT77_PODMU